MSIEIIHDWHELNCKFFASPYPSICIDNFLNSESAKEIADSYPGYDIALRKGKEFQKVNERGKTEVTNPNLFPEPVNNLANTLSSKSFINNLETLTGIDNLIWDPGFVGGGMHLTKTSGHLDVHVDFNYERNLGLHRRINLLLYFNTHWGKEWGGELELWDKDVKNCFNRIAPILNRCVIFQTSEISFHGVTAVNCPPGVSRNSFAVYYYSKEPPENWSGKYHTTIFKTRPNETSKKLLLMPLEKFWYSALIQKLRRIMRRIYKS